MAKLSGTRLGKYQVGERLGRGGMAEVYKAFPPSLERHVAIKVLHSFLSDGENFLARFQREAKAIAALDHPNIIQIYDIDTEDEHYYMVMELIEGSTLKNRLAQSSTPLPLLEIVYIFDKVAFALDYAHQQGMLHRDIKPANILLGKDDRVVLADFGIARILSDTQFTMTGALIGTPAYMSPEQGKSQSASPVSDIYSLGILLYEMLTGEVPFDADTPLEIIRQHVNAPLPSPRAIRKDIPEALEKVIVKATEKDPSERFLTASEMVNAVDTALEASLSGINPQKAIITSGKKLPSTKKTIIAQKPANAIFFKKRSTEKKPSVEERMKFMPIILSIIAITLIAGLLAWALPKISIEPIENTACTSAEACNDLANEHMSKAEIEEALRAIESAINLIPEGEQHQYAHLWCFKGEMLASLALREEAIWDFEECIHWSDGNPELDGLRAFAEEQIDLLNEQ